MTGFRIRIIVKGRVGPIVRSVLASLDAEVMSRHDMFIVGPGGLPELLAALESLHWRGVEVDRINSVTRFVEDPARTEPRPMGDTVG